MANCINTALAALADMPELGDPVQRFELLTTLAHGA